MISSIYAVLWCQQLVIEGVIVSRTCWFDLAPHKKHNKFTFWHLRGLLKTCLDIWIEILLQRICQTRAQSLKFLPLDGSRAASAHGYCFPNVRCGWSCRGLRTSRYKPELITPITYSGIISDDDGDENWNKSLSTPHCSYHRLCLEKEVPPEI